MQIRVNWRAAIMFGSNGNVLQGRAQRIGRSKALISVDRNLPAGGYCELALMPPCEQPGGNAPQMRGRAEILCSVLAADMFQITVRWLDMDENSKRLLEEKLQSAARK
jgi:hypothetical protein